MSKDKAKAAHAAAGACLECDDHEGAMRHVGSMLAALKAASRASKGDPRAALVEEAMEYAAGPKPEAGEPKREEQDEAKRPVKMGMRDRMAALRKAKA